MVLRIILRDRDFLARERADRGRRFPERHGHEMSDLAVGALEDVDREIAWHRSVVRNRVRREKCAIPRRFRGGPAPVPEARDHRGGSVASHAAASRTAPNRRTRTPRLTATV